MLKWLVRNLSYAQGQLHHRTREYFYFIDHHGQLFLDDTKVKNFVTCFKDLKFLDFFFKRVRVNDTERYEEEFPYISPCGRELNFIRCEDVPVVYSHLIYSTTKEVINLSNFKSEPRPQKESPYALSYGGTAAPVTTLSVSFDPPSLIMNPQNGRVYHPAPSQMGGVGLIKSSLAMQLSSGFEYTDSSTIPTHFHWLGDQYKLSYNLKLNKRK